MTFKKPGDFLQYDDLISVMFSQSGEILEASIDEFFTLESKANGCVVLTLKGIDDAKPYKILIESDTKVTVRPFGVRVGDDT